MSKKRTSHCCAHCQRNDIKLSACSTCMLVRYCSTDCQRKDRKLHKVVCSPSNIQAGKDIKTFINDVISRNTIIYLIKALAHHWLHDTTDTLDVNIQQLGGSDQPRAKYVCFISRSPPKHVSRDDAYLAVFAIKDIEIGTAAQFGKLECTVLHDCMTAAGAIDFADLGNKVCAFFGPSDYCAVMINKKLHDISLMD